MLSLFNTCRNRSTESRCIRERPTNPEHSANRRSCQLVFECLADRLATAVGITRRNRSNTKRHSRLNVESLADRIMPAVGINNGTLEIVGGLLRDCASVWETQQGFETIVHVNLNGAVTQYFKVLMPHGIRFDGKAADDYLWNTANVVVKAKGGTGDDYIEGGPQADILYGGTDNDT